jgi:flagellar assembly factor FliW
VALKLHIGVRMPVAHTRRFGVLEYDASSVLTFPAGLPGFEGHTQFAVVEQAELAPIVFLQSLTTPELCFLAAPVAAIDPQYTPSLSHEDLDRLGLDPAQQPVPGVDVLLLALLCAPENGPLTANLLAPAVVNLRTRLAVQAVRCDARYSHQHRIEAGTSSMEPLCS